MPKWGLTPIQRKEKPWGLPAEELAPAKTITDPVHGDIFITRLEKRVIDSEPMQRLRRVRQLGTTHFVYPGASHSRFSHSLGALRAAQDLLDAVIDHRNGPHSVHDLFAEWESDQLTFEHKVAEATVLARLGALLHDMTHVPFGHSIEDDVGVLIPHDENVGRFERLWAHFDPDLRKLLDGELASELRPLILSKEHKDEDEKARRQRSKYPFVADIVGNTICADLLDYLRRDHLFTGLPAGFGHRFIDGFYVTSAKHHYHPAQMAMQIARDGRPRADVVSELFKFLRYRYELSERALVHHAKLAADAMIGKLLEMWRDAIWLEIAARRHPHVVQANASDIDLARQQLETEDKSAGKIIDEQSTDFLEREFSRRSDDGLIERILDWAETEPSGKRKTAIATLGRDIQTRRLFKPIGRCSSARPQASEVFKEFGGPDARRRLEQSAARYAGLDHRWHVVLWVPAPTMRLKAAEVLVDDGKSITMLKDLDRAELNRGQEIYKSHEALWAVTVFAPARVKKDDERRSVLLAYLSQEMGISWDEPKDLPKLTALAARHVSSDMDLRQSENEDLFRVATAGLSARGGESTFADLVARVHAAAEVQLQRGGKAVPKPPAPDAKHGVIKPSDSKGAPKEEPGPKKLL